ncbi:MAG: hypothetical protein ACKO8F_07225 [Acidimicrobiaceae bacterium]
MTNQPVNLSPAGPPETQLPNYDPEAIKLLNVALGVETDKRRDAVCRVVAKYPTFLAGWASIGDLSAS